MFLGIEIGGTKIQVGVGAGDGGPLVGLEREETDPAAGAAGILEQIERMAARLMQRHSIRAVGVGFGGPVNPSTGVVIKSHQIEGWLDFPLAAWCEKTFAAPAIVGNDADVAGLAEARFGAGRGKSPVLYVTVGTGIGGGLIIGGQIYRGASGGAAEIGHLRAGLHAERSDQTIESVASGWGIAATAQSWLTGPVAHRLTPLMRESRPTDREGLRQRLLEEEEASEEYIADLRQRCDGDIDQITARLVAQAAAEGNALAQEVLFDAWQALGWGIAQAITLISPRVVVVGGGVSLIGETLFFEPLRAAVTRYVFPPFAHTYEILPAQLGEEVVVHGALALAADRMASSSKHK